MHVATDGVDTRTRSHDPVYLDTSAIVSAIMRRTTFHESAAAYCQQLVDTRVTVILSPLQPVELLQALVSVGNDPTQLQGSVRRSYRLHRWGDDEHIRRRWLSDGFQLYTEFLSQFETVSEMVVSDTVISAGIELMARFKLKSADAFHLAIAVASGAAALATTDRDFIRAAGQTSVRIDLI